MNETKIKRPIEMLDYDVDYSDWLPAGDTIVNPVAVSEKPDELQITACQVIGAIVKVWVSGGLDKASYDITVQTPTVGGRFKEYVFTIRVRK